MSYIHGADAAFAGRHKQRRLAPERFQHPKLEHVVIPGIQVIASVKTAQKLCPADAEFATACLVEQRAALGLGQLNDLNAVLVSGEQGPAHGFIIPQEGHP